MNTRPPRSSSGLRQMRLLALAGVLLAGLASGRAEDVVLDFPLPQPNTARLPDGLAAWPKETAKGLAAIEIPLLKISENGSVLVAVIFRDAEGALLQASWKTSAGRSTVLVSNLSEGVNGWNQRILKVPYELLQGDGSLVFETESAQQLVRRVALSWTWPAGLYLNPRATAVKYVQSPRQVLTERDLDTGKPAPVPDTLSGGIWKASLQEKPESLANDISFAFPMEKVPSAAVLRVRLLGIPLGQSVPVWINGTRVDALALETPDLGAAGYFKAGEKLGFAGWRDAALVVPSGLLHTGDNTILLKAQASAYAKEALLELNFDHEGAPLALDAGDAPPEPKNVPAPTGGNPVVIAVPTNP